ncbi:unnamed protein product, partial [Prorocentrum cordatum]
MHYGSGAKKERQKIAREKVTRIELENIPIKVQLVTQQKALGTIITAGGVMGPEICLRVNRTHGAARPLEKQLLRRKKLSMKAKIKYVHALSTSSLIYNHHVWNRLTKKDRNHIATRYMGPYRVAASMPNTNTPDKHVTNSEAIAKTGIPDFDKHQTDQHDSDIINWARQRPKHCTTAVKSATKFHLHYTRDKDQLVRFQKVIRMPMAPSSTVDIEHSDHDSKTKYVCYICGRTATKQGMAVHMGRDHPDSGNPRRWATGAACRCCQPELHTFPRLLKHLAVAHCCRKSWHAWHAMTMEPLTEQQIADSHDAIATTTAANKKCGRQATFSEIPAYKIDIMPLPLIET